MLRLTLSRLQVNLQFGGMCIESCKALDPHAHHKGQYCWQDPDGKRHYNLRTHHMRTLVKYVEQGGVIETHDGIPNNLHEQLYTEENRLLGKSPK